MKKLSILIVNWNTSSYLKQCLLSIRSQCTSIDHDIFVFDNNSTDNSVEMLNKEFKEVKLFTSGINIGFGGANNSLLKHTESEYILFLNPDTLFLDNTLIKMIEYMDKNISIGASGCKILNEDGSLQPTCARSFPDLFTVFSEQLFLYKLFPKSKLFSKHLMTYWNHGDIKEVELLSGAMILTKKIVIDNTGTFDERFYMYGEDIDLCWRIKHNGWKIVFYPYCTITHFGGKSTIQSFVDNFYLSYSTLDLFFSKYKSKPYVAFFRLFVILGCIIRFLASVAVYLPSNSFQKKNISLKIKVYVQVINNFIAITKTNESFIN